MPSSQPLSEIELRRLAHVKGLFRVGRANYERGIGIYLAQAALTFDNCVEMLLWALANHYEIKLSRDNTFPKMVGEIAAELDKVTPKHPFPRYKSDLLWMHAIRTSIQHHGIVPSRENLKRCQDIAEEVLRETVEHSFPLKWNAISLALLLNDRVARELYLQAEEAFATNQFTKASAALVAAFECSKLRETDRRAGSHIGLKRFGVESLSQALTQQQSKEHGEKSLAAIADYALAIEKEVEVLKLGIDYKGYQKYRDLTGIDPFDHSKFRAEAARGASGLLDAAMVELSPKFVTMREIDLQEWVIFGLDFVLDSLLRWQEVDRTGQMERILAAIDSRTRQKSDST